MKEWITGKNPVYECLLSNRRHFFRLLMLRGMEEGTRTTEIQTMARQFKLQVEQVDRNILAEINEHNQGVALEVSAYPYSNLDEIFSLAVKRSEPLFMLLLDQIQDPQNFGTLIRSAELFGVHGILIPPDRAAGVTPAVVHSSSGGSEHLLIAQGNLAQAIDLIKTRDAWVIGLDMDPSSQSLEKTDLSGALALVVGSESGGLRRLVCEKCDLVVHIPTTGRLDSLNAAVAGSIALYAASLKRT
jgi:23S rRNA (guanosine2251-2'-O)-methyltransferase